jgi:phosphoenolpyruvate carboxylase
VGLEKFIIDLAKYIPQRRERLQHTGHFGYSRQIGGTGLSLPRAITFTSVFYSVGVPPEFIGMGRGLKEAKARGLLKKLLFFYPDLNEIILKIGRYLNRENLEILAKRYELWDLVRTGLGFLEEYIGEKMGPLKPDEILHRNYTSNVLQKWLQGSDPQEDIILAAQIRRSLG